MSQNKALDIVRAHFGDKETSGLKIKQFCLLAAGEIWDMAPWAWSDCQSLTFDVNWQEIYEHFELKVKEERNA